MDDHQMGGQEIECGQILLGIPYRKINDLKFTKITPLTNKNPPSFSIQLECKYDGLNKPKPTLILRTIQDFQWLSNQLKTHTEGRFLILPLLTTQSSLKDTLINYFTQKPSSTQNTHHQTQNNSHKTSIQIMITRYLKIMSEISLNNFYIKPNLFENPLFIFIQQEETYKFYQSLYEKEKKAKQISLKGYLAGFLEYVPGFGKKKVIQAAGMQLIYEQFEKLHNKSLQMLQKVKHHYDRLVKVQQNFIRKQLRNKLKQKLRRVSQLIENLYFYLRWLSLIMQEIFQNIEQYGALVGDKEVDQNGNKSICRYIEYLQQEKQQIQAGITNINRQFLEKSINQTQRVNIQLGQIYSDYQQVIK